MLFTELIEFVFYHFTGYNFFWVSFKAFKSFNIEGNNLDIFNRREEKFGFYCVYFGKNTWTRLIIAVTLAEVVIILDFCWSEIRKLRSDKLIISWLKWTLLGNYLIVVVPQILIALFIPILVLFYWFSDSLNFWSLISLINSLILLFFVSSS